MNRDIRKVLQLIDTQIDVLADVRGKLTQAFGNTPSGFAGRKTGAKVKQSNHSTGNGASRNGNGPTRKAELIKFFATHGPAKRSEITAETKIPGGTVANLLTKNEFVQHADGKWDVRKEAVQ